MRHLPRQLLTRACGVFACWCIACLLVPSAGIAQTPNASLRLESQTSYVPADGVFTLVLSYEGPINANVKVRTLIHQAIASEQDLNVQNFDVLASVPHQGEVALTSLPRTSEGHLRIEIPVRSFRADDPSSYYLPESGVHPITVLVNSPDGQLASLSTTLIHLPSDATEITPVPISIVVPVSQAEGFTINDITQVLLQHPDLPLTVKLGPGVLSQLETQQDTETLSGFVAALRGRPVVVGPELNLDPSALAEIDQPGLYRSSLEAARNKARSLGLTPDVTVLPWTGTLTSDGIDLLGRLGVKILVTDSAETSSSMGTFTGDTSTLSVVNPTTELSSELRRTDPLVVAANPRQDDAIARAHRLLARLDLLVRSRTNGVVLGGDPSTLDPVSLSVVLNSLEQLSPLEAVPLEEVLQSTQAINNRPAERPQQNLLPVQGQVANIEETITTYRGLFLSGGASPDQYYTALGSALSRERNPQDRQLRLEQIETSLNTSFEGISILPNQQFTLTAVRFAVPLQLRNSGDGPRRILLRFASSKIQVYSDENYTESGDIIVDLPTDDTTITLYIEAQALGLSPVDVIALSPDGKQELARQRITVRSTAIPGLGLALSGAAGIFLLVWWVRHHRRERTVTASSASDTTADSVDP